MIIPMHGQEGFPAIYFLRNDIDQSHMELRNDTYYVCRSSSPHSVTSVGLMWWSALLGPKLGGAPFLRVQKLNQVFFNKMVGG